MIDAVIAAIAGQLAATAAKPLFEKTVDAVVEKLGKRGSPTELRSRLREAGEGRATDPVEAKERIESVIEGWVSRFSIEHDDIQAAERSVGQIIGGSVHGLNFPVGNAGSNNTFNLYHYTNTSSSSEDEAQPEEATDAADAATGIGCIAIIALLIAAAIFVLLKSCGSEEADAFPGKSDPFPAGISKAQIFAPVAARLHACAKTRVAQPANCPQRLSTSENSSGTVKWAMHGNPIDGSKIAFMHDVFQVIGHTVMTVTYTDSAGNEAQGVHFVKYLAKLRNHGGQLTLIDLIPTKLQPQQPITKNPIAVSWGGAGNAIREAFKSCSDAGTVPLPPGCPQGIDDPGFYDHAKWRVVEDPFGNATWDFDQSWGILRVTGSYALDVEYRTPLVGLERKSQNGNYSAIVSLDRGKVHVLSIDER